VTAKTPLKFYLALEIDKLLKIRYGCIVKKTTRDNSCSYGAIVETFDADVLCGQFLGWSSGLHCSAEGRTVMNFASPESLTDFVFCGTIEDSLIFSLDQQSFGVKSRIKQFG